MQTTTTELNADTEYKLTCGKQSAIVSPFGASLRRYFLKTEHGQWNAIWGYEGGANKKGGQGDVLVPFPGRIKNGEYHFNNQTFRLLKNDKDGPNAIHGFFRATLFEVKSANSKHAVFTADLRAAEFFEKGYPFSLHIEIAYELNENGLTTSYKIKNVGEIPAPAGIGFHPYFRAERGTLADWQVTIPAQKYIELEKIVPTGRILPVDGTKLDFRKGRTIAQETYNDCVAKLDRDADGFATATLTREYDAKGRVTIRMDRSFDYVVIYTGDQIPAPDQRLGFAIEPMTCAPDAFNYANWGSVKLAPGAEMAGAYTIFAEEFE